jgi:hypothetical protein
MKRQILPAYVFAVGLIILMTPVGAELYQRAPDTVPGTLPEMRTPAFWIDRMDNPDEVIMPLAEIAERNETYRAKMSRPDPFSGVHEGRVPLDWQLNRWPGRFIIRPDIDNMGGQALAALVREQIGACTDYITAESYGNYLGVPYAEHQIAAISHETALDAVARTVTSEFGITVRETVLRIIPAPFPAVVGIKNIDTTNYSVDLWTSALLHTGQPVEILHRSRTGSHLFVMTRNNFGWIAAEDAALCERREMETHADPDAFLVCTGNRVPYYAEKECRIVSGWFRMGDRIPVSDTGDTRRVIVPIRTSDASYAPATGWLKPDADIHAGYVPYTRKNIVTLAFKLLDDPYDWTGAAIGRNHETTYRDIFTCFGFELPHNGGLFTFFGDIDVAATPGIGEDATYALVNEREPFVSFAISRGHAMLILGEHNGTPVAFDQNGYSYTDEDGAVWQVKRCSIITPGIVSYFLTYPVTFLEIR